jgi:hypothetical protein
VRVICLKELRDLNRQLLMNTQRCTTWVGERDDDDDDVHSP